MVALAEAFVVVKPDLTEFKTGMDRVGKDYSVKVKASPDTTGFKEKLDQDVKRDGTTAKVKVEASSSTRGGFFSRMKGGLNKESESVGKEAGRRMGGGPSGGISNALSGGGVQTAALAGGGGFAFVLKQGANLNSVNARLYPDAAAPGARLGPPGPAPYLCRRTGRLGMPGLPVAWHTR